MKAHHVSRTWSGPLSMNLGKHFCPVCGTKLKKIKVSKIVNSRSEEAKDYDFSSGDVYMIGNVKFIWTEFFCSRCSKNYSVKDIYEAEKQSPKNRRKLT